MTRIKMTALALVSAACLAGCGAEGELLDEDVETQQSAVTIGGLILAKWNVLGGAAGVMGNVTTNELDTAFGTGRYNFFQHGRILWKGGAAAAFSTYNNIDTAYAALGMEWGLLGFPTKDEYLRGNGSPGTENNKEVDFENGRMRRNGNATPWPVLIKASGSQLGTMSWARITGGSVPQESNGNGCLKNFAGAGFTPGKTISVFLNNPDTSSQISGTATVRNDGTFTVPTQSGSICMVSAVIKKINFGITLEARDSAGKRAASFITTAAGGTFGGQI